MRFYLLFFAILVLVSCKQKVGETPDVYEPSELALLMRQMEIENAQLRKAILDNDSNLVYPSSYTALITSKPTQEGTINDTYKSFSVAYDMAMEDLKHGDSSLTHRFNNGVKACVNCHTQFCGGPIERIEKLLIP